MLVSIKKNDKVLVIAGKDKGKHGDVIEVFPKKSKVRVKGVSIVTRHVKARKQGETGGIIKSEGLIDLSNVMLMCAACSKPTRVGAKVLDSNSKKVRVCRRCKQAI
jgi:large subunit ribosomal protein L24